MDSEPPRRPPPRKVKFQPKPQKPKVAVPSRRKKSGDATQAQELNQHVNDRNSPRRQRSGVESESTVQAASIHGQKQPYTSRASNVRKGGSHTESSGSEVKDDMGENNEVIASSTDELSVIKEDSSSDNEYREPWDYSTYYPTTVPWRKPYSGDPEILNEAEFGEAAQKLEYDESTMNPASDLGLSDPAVVSEKPRLLFLQLPKSLPVVKGSSTAKGKEKEGTSTIPDEKDSVVSAMGGKVSSSKEGTSERGCSLEELPAGQIGKLLVFKSGAVKLKVGDVYLDVATGSECTFPQDVVAINTKEKEFLVIGELQKKAVVTPYVDSPSDS